MRHSRHPARLGGGRLLATAALGVLAAASLPGLARTAAAAQDVSSETGLPGRAALASLDRMVGEWTYEGRAGEVPYVAAQTVAWNEDRSALDVTWTLTDDSGTRFAGGRGRIAWDEFAGAVVNRFSGRDADRAFTGSATMIDADDVVTDWRGHESRGAGESLNFEVTYDLRDADRLVVDFIPTCIDGSGASDPIRFAWERLDPLSRALPIADALGGEWTLASGGRDGMPDGSRLAVARAAGGRSLTLVMREPGDGGGLLGTEVIWIDPDTGALRDRYLSADGSLSTGIPRIGTRGDDDTPVLMVRWGEALSDGMDDMRITSWLWLEDDRIHVAFTDLTVDGVEGEAPPTMIWERR